MPTLMHRTMVYTDTFKKWVVIQTYSDGSLSVYNFVRKSSALRKLAKLGGEFHRHFNCLEGAR